MSTSEKKAKDRPSLSIAPMMGYTNRHFRYLMRAITKDTLLYSEMISSQAVLHGKREALLGFSSIEKPLVLQVAGSDPKSLSLCARIAEDFNYDEVNLNVGCPSADAQAGEFGVCLMQKPRKVAECVAAMQASTALPISIKHRIGLGREADFEKLSDFVSQTSQAGCRKYIVHARTALLSKLSPKKNRTVPPLRYDLVYALARDFAHLRIELNGGICDLQRAFALLKNGTDPKSPLGGIMIGRAAYERPYLFAQADRIFYGSTQAVPSRRQILGHLESYLEKWPQEGERTRILKYAFHLFKGLPGARFWRSYLSNSAHLKQKPKDLLSKASAHIPSHLLDEIAEGQHNKDAQGHGSP